MTIPLLICDDSNMARKQVARALPEEWEVDITFATNGRALGALDFIKKPINSDKLRDTLNKFGLI